MYGVIIPLAYCAYLITSQSYSKSSITFLKYIKYVTNIYNKKYFLINKNSSHQKAYLANFRSDVDSYLLILNIRSKNVTNKLLAVVFYSDEYLSSAVDTVLFPGFLHIR